MFCHQGIGFIYPVATTYSIIRCNYYCYDDWKLWLLTPEEKMAYGIWKDNTKKQVLPTALAWTFAKETTHHVDFNSLFFGLCPILEREMREKCCIYTELRYDSNPHFIAAKLGVCPMHDLIRGRFYFKSESFPAICIRYSMVSALLKSESKYRVAKMIWTTVSDSASAFRRVGVRVCMWLVMLAPGSPAQAKLPVRSWHHLPPSHAYTEDNRALLWGSCDLSVQLVCPYFCHPIRI